MLKLTFVKTLLQVNHLNDDECVTGKLFMSSEVLASCQTSNVCERHRIRHGHDMIVYRGENWPRRYWKMKKVCS